MIPTTKMMRLALGATSILLVTVAVGRTSAEARTAAQCWATHKNCIARCKRVFEGADRVDACYKRCDAKVMECVPSGGSTKYEPPPEPLNAGRRPSAPLDGGILETKPTFNPRGPGATGLPTSGIKPGAAVPQIR